MFVTRRNETGASGGTRGTPDTPNFLENACFRRIEVGRVRPFKPVVVGSNPTRPTKFFRKAGLRGRIEEIDVALGYRRTEPLRRRVHQPMVMGAVMSEPESVPDLVGHDRPDFRR